jgi:hypothetical protein
MSRRGGQEKTGPEYRLSDTDNVMACPSSGESPRLDRRWHQKFMGM